MLAERNFSINQEARIPLPTFRRQSRCARYLMADDQSKGSPESEKKSVEEPRQPKEIGGPKGPEPTRYGDWEVNGRCTDF